ncbi:ABC transporter permease subunit [Paenibacillus sp. LMG 31459]|jgi:putative aldouronate transport system permease protein|uniref:Sugar ABC transporter permease n=2 Tax=Paenibacillus TaxID=44249 RepID=A0A089LK88_PAEBO|nr:MULTISPECIES: carbohydrate ABC transporter permease [Paenibacillus]AIQ60505.1 sugar ABC transporter permease [Paenibacillus borealis]NOU82503.1 ABC transporter permease subunit [Paenibacillus phytohabitans]
MRSKTIGSLCFDAGIYLFLTAMGLITLLPFANVLSKSVSEEWAITSGKVGIFPVGFQLDTMKFVVTSSQFLHSLLISVIVTLVGTLLSLLITAMTAYPLSKRELPGSGILIVMFIFTMMFSGGIIPNYLLIRQLGLINHLGSLILPALINVFNMLVIKSYFESLPESLEESAKLEGARNYTILFRIILPLSAPVLATIGLFYAVSFWNDYFNPMLYINSSNLKPLQLYLQDIVMNADSSSLNRSADDLMNVPAEGVRAATVIASTVPILLVYPFLQKYFIKGVLIGSVKG